MEVMNKPLNGTRTKIIQTILGAVVIAALTSTGGLLYTHEIDIDHADREISKLRARLYRERVKNYEYHERYMRSVIQIIKLRENKEGLSIVNTSRLAFYIDQRELIQEEKSNYIETWKHQGQ